jgi:hypothetical protein
MVKNAAGGNKSKGFARKDLTKRSAALRIAKEEGEVYAQAVKIMGGYIASAIDLDGNPLTAHIRGKFRGRGKRDNFIGPNTWLLVGLHTWEADKINATDVRNCDILEVYNDSDKTRLKNSVTSVNWNKFITNDTKMLSSNTKEDTDETTTGILFADDATQEYEDLIASQLGLKKPMTIIMDDKIVDVDDI